MKKTHASAVKITRKGVQSGQAILFIAVIMVGLIGALGLAIDGGGMLFLYRDIQNATDAAVVAATYARCTNATPDNVIAAGMQAAAANGFTNDTVDDWVTVRNPPATGPGAGNPAYVEVSIRAAKPSYFIQLVYPGPLEVTNYSIGRCQPPFSPASVGAIVGLSQTCTNPDTVGISGAGQRIEGGIHSNRDLANTGGGQGITIVGPVTAVGTVKPDPANKVTYDPLNPPATGSQYLRPDPMADYFSIREFAPGGRIWNSVGIRTEITAASPQTRVVNGRLLWEPRGVVLTGLYYIDGDVDISGSVRDGQPAGPNDVRVPLQGVTIAATGEIKLVQANFMRYYIDGFLLVSNRQESCTNKAIEFSGQTEATGVLYAPRGGIKASFNNGTFVGAIVGQTIDFSGSDSTIIYDPRILPPIPPQVELAE